MNQDEQSIAPTGLPVSPKGGYQALQHYGWAQVFLHWLSAIWVLGLFASGYWMVTLTYYDPLYRTVPFYHKSFGILFCLLLGCRLMVRFVKNQPLAPPSGMKAWQIRAAHAGHFCLYLAMLCVPVLGYGISTADGRAISVFNLFEIPALPWRWSNQEDILGMLHKWGAYGLMALAAGHACMAFVHGRAVLGRMLPFLLRR